MSMEWKEKIIYPTGADQAFLKKYEKKHQTARAKRFQEEHEAFLHNAELHRIGMESLVQELGIKPENRAAIEKAFKAMFQKIKKIKKAPPSVKALQGHNAARYAPFDFSGYGRSIGGGSYSYLVGPDAAGGAIGANNGTYFPGGGVSTQTGISFWYWAARQATLQVTVHASAYASAAVAAGLFGYAQSFIALRASIQQWASPFARQFGDTVIYDVSGPIAIHERQGHANESFTASVALPLEPNNWYWISADAIQRAYSGGLAGASSTFSAGVGPISYMEV